MKVWDLPTRLYHWLQAGLIMGLVVSGFRGEGPHIYLGLGLFTLLMWRVVWGFIGSETSRFKEFICSPKTVILYLLGKHTAKAGHNPAGGWMIITMITTILLQCLTGLVIAGLFDNFPFTDEWLTYSVYDFCALSHGIFANLLQLLIVVHLLAILFYKFRSKPLVWAMVVGVQKKLPAGEIMMASNVRAILVLVVTGLVTIAIVTLSSL